MQALKIRRDDTGTRLDVWLSKHLPEHSRARWQVLIKEGHVFVDTKNQKPNYHLQGNETIHYEIPAPKPIALNPEPLPLDICYEDKDIIVINKPPGLVVHPAPGHVSGTLANALLSHCKDLTGIGGERRPGIVHRLDKNTSGAMVIAKNETALNQLARQFRARKVKKHYTILVWGQVTPATGTITTLIGRSPHNRKKMAANPRIGREAISHYAITERFKDSTRLRVHIETGRTHQIRVHMTHLGYPIMGDTQYGRARHNKLDRTIHRQMLHAEHLAFSHPRTDELLAFTISLPEDMRGLIERLREKSLPQNMQQKKAM